MVVDAVDRQGIDISASRSKDYETAVACYHSPEYQALVKARAPHSQGDIVIIEGYDGPQP